MTAPDADITVWSRLEAFCTADSAITPSRPLPWPSSNELATPPPARQNPDAPIEPPSRSRKLRPFTPRPCRRLPHERAPSPRLIASSIKSQQAKQWLHHLGFFPVSKPIHSYRIGYSVISIQDDENLCSLTRTANTKKFRHSHAAASWSRDGTRVASHPIVASRMRQNAAKESGGDHDLGDYHCSNLYRRNLCDSFGVVAGVMTFSMQRRQRQCVTAPSITSTCLPSMHYAESALHSKTYGR